MAVYALGDVQGCFRSFMALLETIGFSPQSDALWFLGDLVNRGPQSLEVLRFAAKHSAAVDAVLGNHDLHLLARHFGVADAKPSDTLEQVLQAPDRTTLIEWLRHRPLMAQAGSYHLVHAGLLPLWNINQALSLAREAEGWLRGPRIHEFLQARRTYRDLRWADNLGECERAGAALTAMTTLRVCDGDGQRDSSFDGAYKQIPSGRYAWFDHPLRCNSEAHILFGHWSALGLYRRKGVVCLDSGCVWGRSLTAMRLEDGQVFTQPSLETRSPERR